MSSLSENKVRIFVSYKHDDIDEEILNQLMVYIQKPITDAGAEFWFDKKIKWGQFWNENIQEQLSKADIAIILVSMPFLNSPYITDVEIDTLLKRRARKELIILPIILRPCDWKSRKWLADTQVFPLNDKTVVQDYPRDTGDRDALFLEILADLKDHIREIKNRKFEASRHQELLESKLQILKNVRKEEETRSRFEFIYVAANMTSSVHKSDLDGSIRIATHSGGPWRVTHEGNLTNLDEALSNFVTEIKFRKGNDAALSQVQIVCPFALSNLHYIRKWHLQGVGIRVNESMDHDIFKWLIAETYATRELLLGYPSGTLEFPVKGADGLVQHGMASTGLRTKDLLAVEYFSGLFDSLYKHSQSVQGKGSELLALKLIEFINKTFREWENDKAKLLQPAIITFEKRSINCRIKWDESIQVFSIDIHSSDENDAETLKRHLELLRQSQEYEHYHLDDTLKITISS